MTLQSISSMAMKGKSHAGNGSIGNSRIYLGSSPAGNNGCLNNSMNHKALPVSSFPISHGFLIEHLYKGYKRYMVTPVTPIRVLYTHVRARKAYGYSDVFDGMEVLYTHVRARKEESL